MLALQDTAIPNLPWTAVINGGVGAFIFWIMWPTIKGLIERQASGMEKLADARVKDAETNAAMSQLLAQVHVELHSHNDAQLAECRQQGEATRAELGRTKREIHDRISGLERMIRPYTPAADQH